MRGRSFCFRFPLGVSARLRRGLGFPRLIAPSLLVAALGLASSARANDPAAAQLLFDQARKLMLKERWSEACPKLEESQRLDPGGGTLLHLAVCRDHEGKTATAWAAYRDALAMARHDGRKDRIRIAQARLEALEPKLARLRVRVAPENRAITGFTVLRDDVPVGEAQWGEPVPVDPGTRTVTARAEGYKTFTTKVDVPATSADLQVEVPALETDFPSREAVSAPPPAAVVVAPPPREESGLSTRQALAVAAAGVGVVGVVVGSVLGLRAFSKTNDADRHCDAPAKTLCDAIGIDEGNQSRTLGTWSTIAFSAGAVFLVGGAILYFTAPSRTVAFGRGIDVRF